MNTTITHTSTYLAGRVAPVAQRGGTIVELMVAIAIGLLIMVAIIAAYISGTRTQSAQSDLARMMEAGRFAVSFISSEVARAGYSYRFYMLTAEGASLPVNAGGKFGSGQTSGFRVQGTDSTDQVSPATNNFPSDTLIIQYYGDDRAMENVADGDTLDCGGSALRRNTRARETLSITVDANNTPWLTCEVEHITTNNVDVTATDTPPCSVEAGGGCRMIPNVESMQFLYGVDMNRNNEVDYYIRAGDMADEDWEAVAIIVVSIVMRSERISTSPDTNAAHDYTHFQGYNDADDIGRTYSAPRDGRIRRVFTKEVFLRNPASPGKEVSAF